MTAEEPAASARSVHIAVSVLECFLSTPELGASEVGRRELAELESEARASPDPLAYSDVVAWLKVTLDHLRHPRAEVETVTQLLAFLRDRHQHARG